MNARTLTFEVLTPLCRIELGDVVHFRFDAGDGSRGVLAGHERATAYVRDGVVELRVAGGAEATERFVATEGGMLVIEPARAVLVTSWAELADDLERLAASVRARSQARERIDMAARTLGARHETALRRALIRLEREVSW